MLELFTKKPVFQGNDEIHQLDVMYKVLGTPTSDRWPGISDMPWYELIKPKDVVASPFRDLFRKYVLVLKFENLGLFNHRWLSPCGLGLAEQLLNYDPAQRITAVQALQHPYFHQEEPSPELPTGYVYTTVCLSLLINFCRLSTLEGEWHELETKREKAKKRKKEGSMH
jgi:CTD kinase subunit alpha